MGGVTYDVLVVFRSANGRNDWYLVKPEDVPDWVKEVDNMARLVDGEVCMNAQSESGTDWFMALPMPTPEDIDVWMAAQTKRAERAAKRMH